jgi:hypothetical protein
MTAVGGSHLFCESWIPNPIFGAGSSIFEVTFDVWSPAAFALVGELTAAAEGDLSRTTAEVRISLTEFEGETLFTHTLNPGPGGTPNSLILAEMGLLTPGLHTLRAVTEGLVRLPENPHTGIADATFDFTFELAPPCPGDLDGDGDVDLADLAQLLANCGTTGGAAYEDGDLDCDGDVDLSDLAELLSRYGTICDWP